MSNCIEIPYASYWFCMNISYWIFSNAYLFPLTLKRQVFSLTYKASPFTSALKSIHSHFFRDNISLSLSHSFIFSFSFSSGFFLWHINIFMFIPWKMKYLALLFFLDMASVLYIPYIYIDICIVYNWFLMPMSICLTSISNSTCSKSNSEFPYYPISTHSNTYVPCECTHHPPG